MKFIFNYKNMEIASIKLKINIKNKTVLICQMFVQVKK